MRDDNASSLRDSLAEGMGEAPWSMLEAHAKRGGLIFVSPSLALLDVAVAVALDEHAQVATWMEQGLLTRPEGDVLSRAESDTDRQWPFVIVQPFVLVTGDA